MSVTVSQRIKVKQNKVQIYARKKLSYNNVNDSYIPRKSQEFNGITTESRKVANFKFKVCILTIDYKTVNVHSFTVVHIKYFSLMLCVFEKIKL